MKDCNGQLCMYVCIWIPYQGPRISQNELNLLIGGLVHQGTFPDLAFKRIVACIFYAVSTAQLVTKCFICSSSSKQHLLLLITGKSSTYKLYFAAIAAYKFTPKSLFIS